MDQSLGERLLAARSRKQAERTETLEIPGYDGQLWAHYQPVAYRRAYEIIRRHEGVRDGAEQTLRVAADTLVAACTGCEARLDGAIHKLMPLGIQLCQEIGIEGAENDLQAVLLIFPSEMEVILHSRQVQDMSVLRTQAIDAELEGNS